MKKLPYKRKPTFIYCLENKLANKAFISLLVTPQNRRPSLTNYLLCLSRGFTKQILGFSLFMSPSTVICLKAKVSVNDKVRS